MTREQNDAVLAAHYETLLAENSILDAERVNQIFLDCLLRPDEFDAASNTPHDPNAVLIVPGIMGTYGLHKARLRSHRNEISVMIDQVDPSYFIESQSGGNSFLNLCNDKFGRQWTGFHRTMEEFCVLAMATGYAVFCAPRVAWPIFPGGMPYFAFRHEPLDDAGIRGWNERLDAVTAELEAGQKGDHVRATEGIKLMTAMMAGLR